MTPPSSRVSGYAEMETAALLLWAAAALKASGHTAAELQSMPARKAKRALESPLVRATQAAMQRYKAKRGTETALLALSVIVAQIREHLGEEWVRLAAGPALVHLDALPHLPDIGGTP